MGPLQMGQYLDIEDMVLRGSSYLVAGLAPISINRQPRHELFFDRLCCGEALVEVPDRFRGGMGWGKGLGKAGDRLMTMLGLSLR